MGRKVVELTGQRFGRLTVIRKYGIDKHNGNVTWLCKCDCGKTTVVSSAKLRRGNTQSCGCLLLESIKKSNTKHGLTGTKIYNEWHGVKQRCYSPTASNYERYGARGIGMCDEWRNDVRAFYNDVSNLPHFGEPGYTLDRIDNNKNYEPGNVRWANSSVQANNRRSNVRVTYNGETKSLKDWSRYFDMPYDVLRNGIRRGLTIDDIIRSSK